MHFQINRSRNRGSLLVVSVKMYFNKILDVIITNVARLYAPPIGVPAVECYLPAVGKKSDHTPAIVFPLANSPWLAVDRLSV